jgi:hypothetical protein
LFLPVFFLAKEGFLGIKEELSQSWWAIHSWSWQGSSARAVNN